MQKITGSPGLKHAIQLLEIEHDFQRQHLQEHFDATLRGLRPANLIRSTLMDLASAPSLMDSVLGTVIGLATGYLMKKIFIGTSGNLFRKLFGAVLQVGVTKTVAGHPEAIKSLGHFIFQQTRSKKKRISGSRDS